MCGTAAHLTDHVFPDVLVRQWVLSVPFELRLLLAREPAALSAVGRIFVQEISRFQLGLASLSGVHRARTGAICFPQRFGGSLNLNVHYHVAVPDGVFTLVAGERARFHQTRTPDDVDLETVALNVELRTLGWLRRRGHLKEDDEETPETEGSAIDACLRGSLGMGELTAVPEKHPKAAVLEPDAPRRPTKSARRGGKSRGFDVHAGVTIAAADREGRERLLRYCARPALSLERMSLLPDGRVAYALRKPWGKHTHRVMTPLSFMARLAALIPPPRHPLIRFAGVFAPHSSWRSKVVPERRECSGPDGEHEHCSGPCPAEVTGQARTSHVCAKPGTITHLLAPGSGSAPTICMGGELVCEAAVGPRHCAPYALRTPSARLDWAELLKRTYDIDALACPCGGRLQFIALIIDRETAKAILDSMSLSSEAPPLARARSPDLVDPHYDAQYGFYDNFQALSEDSLPSERPPAQPRGPLEVLPPGRLNTIPSNSSRLPVCSATSSSSVPASRTTINHS